MASLASTGNKCINERAMFLIFSLTYLYSLSNCAVLRDLHSDKDISEIPFSDSSTLKQLHPKVTERVIWTKVNTTNSFEQDTEIEDSNESFASKNGSKLSTEEADNSKNSNPLEDSLLSSISQRNIPEQVIWADAITTKPFDHNVQIENGNESFIFRNHSLEATEQIKNPGMSKHQSNELLNSDILALNTGNKLDSELSKGEFDMVSSITRISNREFLPESQFFNSTSEKKSSTTDIQDHSETLLIDLELENSKQETDIIQKRKHPLDEKPIHKGENSNVHDSDNFTFSEDFESIKLPSNTSDMQRNFSINSTELNKISSLAHAVEQNTTLSELLTEKVDIKDLDEVNSENESIEDLEIFKELLSAAEMQFPGLSATMNMELNEVSSSDESLLSDISEGNKVFRFPNASTFTEISQEVANNSEPSEHSVNAIEDELNLLALPEKEKDNSKCSAFSSESEGLIDVCRETFLEVESFPDSVDKITSESFVENDEKLSEIKINSSEATISKQCPPPGFCLFWFMARDKCTNDKQCPSSQSCCLSRCSRICIQL